MPKAFQTERNRASFSVSLSLEEYEQLEQLQGVEGATRNGVIRLALKEFAGKKLAKSPKAKTPAA